MSADRSSRRREWLVIAGLTLIGAVLRFWAFGGLSLSHFDEGIYAFAGLWIGSKAGPMAIDPMVIPYAPPGFPILVGVSYLVVGTSDAAAILAATVCGVATIPLVGWIGRHAFGPGAGASAAVFAALSMAHVAFSRKALTDVPFLLAWLIAIGLGARFLERPGLGRALVLGLAVGLAQNVKYNGWLAGIVVALAAVLGTLMHREERRRGPLLCTYGWGLVAALTAALAYAPWFGFVNEHGGYSALLRHHRSYLGGLASWWPNWNLQLAEAFALSGSRSWGLLIWAVALIAGGWTSRGIRMISVRSRHGAFGILGWLGLGSVLFTLQPNLGWWVGLGWSPWLLCDSRPTLRLLGGWWLLLSVMTPFYHPYARLWLPLHAVGWLFLGGLTARFGPFRELVVEGSKTSVPDQTPIGPTQRGVRWGVALGCLALSALQLGRAVPVAMPWDWVLIPQPSRSLRAFVFQDLPEVDALRGKTLRVLARRPLVFYLADQGRFPFQLERGLDSLTEPAQAETWAVIDEAMILQEGTREAALKRLLRYWRPVRSRRVVVDPVTILDLNPAASLGRPQRSVEIWLMSPRIPPDPPPAPGAHP